MNKEKICSIISGALENSVISMWEWDFKKDIVFAESLKTRILEYGPDSCLKNCGFRKCLEIMHPDDCNCAIQSFIDHLTGDSFLCRCSCRFIKADGTFTWQVIKGNTVQWDQKGAPSKLMGVSIDLGDTIAEISRDKKISEAIKNELFTNIGFEDNFVICSSCHKIKITSRIWIKGDFPIDNNILETVSHGICPDCIRNLYPEEADEIMWESKI